jgi:hypothetical protein
MKTNSPAFSSFRELIDKWNEAQEKEKIEKLADEENICFFFVKDDTVYGGTEESRLIFAKMKNPDADEGKKWIKDANFTGLDLAKTLKGEKSQKLFARNDIKSIKIISREDAFEKIG